MLKKYVFLTLFVLSILISPSIINAESPSDIANQIAELWRQITVLQEQLARLRGQSNEWCYTFEKNLGIGATGNDAIALREALNKKDFVISDKTQVYTEEAVSAVSAFQLKYKNEILTPNGLTSPTGYVGPATRRVLNRLYGCKNIENTQAPSITLISPNGGETWKIKSEQKIRWSLSKQVPENYYLNIWLIGGPNNVGGRLAGLRGPIKQQGEQVFTFSDAISSSGGDILTRLQPGPYKLSLELSYNTPTSQPSVFVPYTVVAKDVSDGWITVTK